MACSPSLAYYFTNFYHYRPFSSSSPSRIKPRHGVQASSSAAAISGLSTSENYPGYISQTMNSTRGNIMVSNHISKCKNGPDHLLVLVHGILASPTDWIYAEAELKRQLGDNFLIYASSSNTYSKTFGGIDEAGKRLAEEVLNVVQKTKSLKRISFLAHSLGGLFARYAIAIHYKDQMDNLADSTVENAEISETTTKLGTIAGLEPVNFITLATPHLGVRGNNQLPFLFGVPILEKLAAPLAPIFIGRTGRQLFLTDGKPNKPPLLLRMSSDYDDKKFISALASFRSRILYANVSYDHMVGWRTSSIRRETELVKPPRRSMDGYKHIVNVVYCPPTSSEGPHFPPEAAKAKEAAQITPNDRGASKYYQIMEEEMIHGLQRVGWTKVDVSFHSAFWPFFAHNNIHVKNEWLHNAGTGVIAHVADSLKREESRTYITASL